jgi:hypothetical protein
MTLTLIFREDPRTGQPRLEVKNGAISSSDQKRIEAELRRRYTHLIHKGASTIEFPREWRSLPEPARFRVYVEKGADGRCPTLILEQEPAGSEETLPIDDAGRDHQPTRPDWVAGFIAELQRMKAPQVLEALKSPDRVGLCFAVDEMAFLAQQDPSTLAPLLMAGYLTIAERMCKNQDDERIGLYVLAARGLDALFGSLVPQRNSAPEPEVRLPMTARFLNWLMGTNKEADGE